MPYANNNGVKIYYEVEGEGPPLVLAHGMGASLNGWRRIGSYNWTDALRNEFKLILFDFMAHGRSDNPLDPVTYLNWMHRDVLAVMDDLRIDRAHYFGYSMGALLGFLTAADYSHRFHSFVLGGFGPYPSESRITRHNQTLEGYIQDLANPNGALARRERAWGRPLTESEKATWATTDTRARIALMTAGIPFLRFLTDAQLSRIAVPCLVFCGDLDPDYHNARECVKRLPAASFVPLPGLNHVQGITQGDLAMPHIKEFLTRVSKT